MKRVWIVVVFSLLLVICISTLYAAEIPITVDINSEPEITSITLTDADGGNVQLNGLDTRIMTCFGTLRDNDSYLDITSFNATFFGQNSTLTAANSAGTHYTNTSCATSGGSGATVNFQCNVTIHHHTEPGSWNCTIMARDSYNTDGQNSTLGTVDSYFGVGVPTATIDFGAYAHSQNSGTTDYSVLANNTGNVRIDFTLDAYSSSGVPADANAMSCTSGSLPVSAIRYATTSGVTATAKTALADAPTSVNVNLDQTPLGSTAYTGSTLYFGIVIPSGGQSGSCTGFLDIGATTP